MDDDEYPIDDLDKAIRDYFANRPPSDVVPREKRPLDRDAILGLDALAASGRVTTEVPPRVLTDPDGNLVGVTEKQVKERVVAGVMILRSQLEAAGLTEAQVPNLTVVG